MKGRNEKFEDTIRSGERLQWRQVRGVRWRLDVERAIIKMRRSMAAFRCTARIVAENGNGAVKMVVGKIPAWSVDEEEEC